MVIDRPQLNVFGIDARKRVATTLRGWYSLTVNIERLNREINDDRKSLSRLSDRIASSIIPRYDTMDMPRGSGISDKTGNLAADIVDKRNELELSIIEKEFDLDTKQRRLTQIENAVNDLNPRDADIVKRYFLYRERYEAICINKRVQKSRFYEILDHALDLMADQI